MDRLSRAAFVALSAAAGFGFYRAVRDGLWWILVIAIVAALFLSLAPQPLAKAIVKKSPSTAVWITQISLLGIVVLGGGIAVGLAALGGFVEGLISKSDEVSKAVAKTIGGSVGVVGSIMVLDDLQSGTGAFWPSSRTQKLLRGAFGATFPHRATPGFDALWEDRLQATVGDKSYDVTGWGLNARLARARVIASALTTLPRTAGPPGPQATTPVGS